MQEHCEPGKDRHSDDGLMWALKTGDLDEVKDKLLTTEDVDRALATKRMPLHYAAEYNHTDVLLFLLSKGAKIDAIDKHGFTPLACACFERSIDCVKILLERGADRDAKGLTGISACEAAANCDCQVIQDLFK